MRSSVNMDLLDGHISGQMKWAVQSASHLLGWASSLATILRPSLLGFIPFSIYKGLSQIYFILPRSGFTVAVLPVRGYQPHSSAMSGPRNGHPLARNPSHPETSDLRGRFGITTSPVSVERAECDLLDPNLSRFTMPPKDFVAKETQLHWAEEAQLAVNTADEGLMMSRWNKLSIYRGSMETGKPQLFSIGPFHLNDVWSQRHYHKDRSLVALFRFYHKSVEPINSALQDCVNDLKFCYEDLEDFDDETFIQMMVKDACFILALALKAEAKISGNGGFDLGPLDPIFGDDPMCWKSIRSDLLIVSNQIPLIVMVKLVSVLEAVPQENARQRVYRLLIFLLEEKDCKAAEANNPPFHLPDFYRKLLAQFAAEPKNQPLHLLDFYHKLLTFPGQNTMVPFEREPMKHGALELSLVGISCKPQANRCNFRGKVGSGGTVILLPRITIDGYFEKIFQNLIAFEKFHWNAGCTFSHFSGIMACLAPTSNDVTILIDADIFVNSVGTNADIAKMWWRLKAAGEVRLSGKSDPYCQFLETQVEKCYERKFSCVRAAAKVRAWFVLLRNTHCANPWVILAVVYGVVSFVSTVVQAIYGVLAYYYK